MTSDYRLITSQDIPVDITISRPIYDYWGRVILRAGQKIPSYQEQSFLLQYPFFVSVDKEPKGYPCHQIPLTDFTLDQQLGLVHDRLSFFIHQKEYPSNLGQAITLFAQHLQKLSEYDAVSVIENFLKKSHPSNALLNSMHCAILTNLIGIQIKMSPEIRQSLSCAALTMNWSIVDLQNELSISPQQPSVQQRNQIISHPTRSYKFLQSIGVQDDIWLKSCLHHHEEPDGRGYPQKITFSEISTPSHLLRLADRFVALVSARATRQGLPAHIAFKQIAGQPQAFPPELIHGLSIIVTQFYPS